MAHVCRVCHGDGDVMCHPVGAPELRARVRCPHCGPLEARYWPLCPLCADDDTDIRDNHFCIGDDK